MDATWQRLGHAAGTRTVGVNRVRVAPGMLPTPPHSHTASEEVFFVLAGSGLAWQDGDVHEVRPRDCVIHRANEHEHTFIAGEDGLEYLVFGTRHPTEVGWLPRSRAIRIGLAVGRGARRRPVGRRGGGRAARLRRPAPRPANILNVDEVELERWQDRHDDGAAGDDASVRELAGFHWERIAPGLAARLRTATPRRRRCSSSSRAARRSSCGRHRHARRPARSWRSIALRPGHSSRGRRGRESRTRSVAGPEGVTMLIYGTRKPNDMAWYPRSRKVFLRGLGVIGRIETLDYHDGEPD